MEWMKALKAKVGVSTARAMTPAESKRKADMDALDKKDAAAELRVKEDAEYAKRQKKGMSWSGAAGSSNTSQMLRKLGD